MSRPPVPLRRIPPPPPLPRPAGKAGGEISTAVTTGLQPNQGSSPHGEPPPVLHKKDAKLEQELAIKVDRDEKNPNPRGPPPPIPPKWTRPNAVDLARALSRHPPPPPPPHQSLGPDVPRRRLPPMPTRLPTPPPEPEAIYENNNSDFCMECRDFSHVDAHAALFPRHTVTSLDVLAADLTQPFPSETDKARAIFTWLYHNIAYDAAAFFSGNIQACTAESTLSSGLAVCDGYSGLFQSLATRVGLQVQRVTGHGKGVGYVTTEPNQPVPEYASNHAWNCVYIDGEWRLIDACWGAGALDGMLYQQRFAPMWFTSAPTEFVRCHFPEDPSYQLISEEEGGCLSWEDYIMEPAGPIIFQDFYQLDLRPSTIQPSTRSIEGGRRNSFCIFKKCEHMSTAEADNFVYMISFADERVPLELNPEGGWSTNIYIPRAAGEVSLYYVTTVSGLDAKGIGIEALKNALGRKAMTFGGLVRWTVV